MRALSVLLMMALVACAEAPAAKKSPKMSPSNDDKSEAATGGEENGGEEPAAEQPETPAPPSSPSTPSGTGVNLRWNKLEGFVYSLDVKTPEGEWIGPCIDVSLIGSSTSTTFEGVCKSAKDRAVANPTAYRLYFTNDIPNAYWADFVEVSPTNTGEVVFALPTSSPSAVDVSWNRKSATAQYSLDVFLKNGETIRPCVDVNTLDKQTSYTFTGACTAAGRNVSMSEVSDFVVCWAENGDWPNAGCSGLPYTGLGRSRAIQN